MKIKEVIKKSSKITVRQFSILKFIILFTVINIFLLLAAMYYFYLYRSLQPVINDANGYKVHSFPYFNETKQVYVDARSVVVMEKDSQVVVYRKNDLFRFSPASSTKIMTALIALENYDISSQFQVTNIKQIEGSVMNLVEGERMRVIDLLYGLLLSSGNDAASVLASYDTEGLDGFVRKMNKKVEELSLSNTHFVDPSGLENGNYTTAYDLTRLVANALTNKTFSEIVNTKSKTVTDVTGTRIHKLYNLNELLGEDGVNGVKTGYTEEAGGVLVTSLVYNNKTYIIVVLKSNDRFLDTKEVIFKIVKNIRLLSF